MDIATSTFTVSEGAYKDIFLKGNKLVNIDALEQYTLDPDAFGSEQPKHSILSNELGLEFDTLETLQTKTGYKFSRLTFIGYLGLADALHDAAPSILCHVQGIVVYGNLSHCHARTDAHNHLTSLKFCNIGMFPYRGTHMFEMWHTIR